MKSERVNWIRNGILEGHANLFVWTYLDKKTVSITNVLPELVEILERYAEYLEEQENLDPDWERDPD